MFDTKLLWNTKYLVFEKWLQLLGEVILWNIQQNDGNNVICKGTNHGDAVTEISWIKSMEVATSLLLATSSLDGFLIVWNFNLTLGALTPKRRYFYAFWKFLYITSQIMTSDVINVITKKVNIVTSFRHQLRHVVNSFWS